MPSGYQLLLKPRVTVTKEADTFLPMLPDFWVDCWWPMDHFWKSECEHCSGICCFISSFNPLDISEAVHILCTCLPFGSMPVLIFLSGWPPSCLHYVSSRQLWLPLPLSPCSRISNLIIKYSLSLFKKNWNSLYRQSYGLSSRHVQMWELDHKEGWRSKNRCFQTVVLEKTLESPLDCREIKPVNPKGNPSWMFIGRTDAEGEAINTLVTWYKELTHWKRPDAGKDWRQQEKWVAEDEMVGWHHWFNGHELSQTMGDGEEQGGLACCSPWCHQVMKAWLSNWATTKTNTWFIILY